MRRKKDTEKKPPPPFKGFTPSQRRDLAACWPARMSAAKRQALDGFLLFAEEALSILLSPFNATSRMGRTEWRTALAGMAKHARALRLAIDRLPDHEYLILSASISRWAEERGLGSRRGHIYERAGAEVTIAQQDVLPVLSALAAHLEQAEREANAKPLKPGRDKGLEHEIIASLVMGHRHFLGKVAASENGRFFNFLKTLGPIIGLSLGPSLLDTVLRDFPQE